MSWWLVGHSVVKALRSLRDAPGLGLLTAGTMAAALLVVGISVMGLKNLERLALLWGRAANVSAYIDESVDPEGWQTLRDKLQGIDGVAQAELLTPEVALERFRARGTEAAALVDGVTAEILPASVDLSLEQGLAGVEHLAAVAAQAAKLPGVTLVDYGREELERLDQLLRFLRLGGVAIGLLFALATAFIVANTIRLIVYARRDEIAVERLVGATAWFVRMPVLIEGAIWGTLGGALAGGLLLLADAALAPYLSEAAAEVLAGIGVTLFAPRVGLGLLVGGLCLGGFGSALAVRRFLDQEVA